MASLADLRKLGASLVLHEGSSEASNWGPSLVADDDMSHLGAIAEYEKQQVAMDARLAGIWEGSTSQELGAYQQRIEFKNDCLHAEAGGRSLGIGAVWYGHCWTTFCIDVVNWQQKVIVFLTKPTAWLRSQCWSIPYPHGSPWTVQWNLIALTLKWFLREATCQHLLHIDQFHPFSNFRCSNCIEMS